MQGFFKFVFRGNALDLAIGVLMGSLFGAFVNDFVAAFLTPLVGWATGSSGNFENKDFHIGNTVFPYGQAINGGITLVLVSAVVYFLVVLPVNKIMADLNPHHDLSKSKRACPECLTPIPAEAKRCFACGVASDAITDEDSTQLIEAVPGQIGNSGSGAPTGIKAPDPA